MSTYLLTYVPTNKTLVTSCGKHFEEWEFSGNGRGRRGRQGLGKRRRPRRFSAVVRRGRVPRRIDDELPPWPTVQRVGDQPSERPQHPEQGVPQSLHRHVWPRCQNPLRLQGKLSASIPRFKQRQMAGVMIGASVNVAQYKVAEDQSYSQSLRVRENYLV